MIPLGDVDRRPLRFPIVTAAIIGVNVAVFLIEVGAVDAFVSRWAGSGRPPASGRLWSAMV